MKKIIYFLIIPIFFLSCEKYIDIEIPNEGRKITVNAFINDTQNPMVYLNQSRFILDGNYTFDPINDATITLLKGEVEVATFNRIDEGKYSTNYICEKGFQYSLKVTQGNEEVSSTTNIPQNSQYQFLDTTSVITSSIDYSTSYLRFKIKINDPAAEENYYMVTFVGQDYPISFYSKEAVIENENDGFMNYALISDQLMNGQSRTLLFDLEYYNFTQEVNRVEMYVNAISKEMYLYYLQLGKYQESQYNFMAEPVMVYSNVTNGLGIFGGYSIAKTTIDIPQLSTIIGFEGKK